MILRGFSFWGSMAIQNEPPLTAILSRHLLAGKSGGVEISRKSEWAGVTEGKRPPPRLLIPQPMSWDVLRR